MTRWIPVCNVDDIPALGSRRVARAHGLDVAVFKAADQRIFAACAIMLGTCRMR